MNVCLLLQHAHWKNIINCRLTRGKNRQHKLFIHSQSKTTKNMTTIIAASTGLVIAVASIARFLTSRSAASTITPSAATAAEHTPTSSATLDEDVQVSVTPGAIVLTEMGASVTIDRNVAQTKQLVHRDLLDFHTKGRKLVKSSRMARPTLSSAASSSCTVHERSTSDAILDEIKARLARRRQDIEDDSNVENYNTTADW